MNPGSGSKLVAAWVMLAGCLAAQTPGYLYLSGIRAWSLGDATRIAIEVSGESVYRHDRLANPDRIYIDLSGVRPQAGSPRYQVIPVGDNLVERVRMSETQPGVTRVVLDLTGPSEYQVSQLANPARVLIEVRRAAVAAAATAAPRKEFQPPASFRMRTAPRPLLASYGPPPASGPGRSPAEISTPFFAPVATPAPFAARTARAAKPQATPAKEASPGLLASRLPQPGSELGMAAPAKRGSEGGSSLTRALGLKVGRIVLDAGHGGSDTGTISRSGVVEKDLVLDVATRLGKLLEQKLGSEVVYTRTEDVFVPLEERTRLANEHRADLFLSIHANSSRYRSVAGMETFYLNFSKSQYDLEVAARENAASAKSLYELSDLVKKIAMQEKIDESREFAQKLQAEGYALAIKKYGKQVRNRGVKKAPFVVLIGASMPSVLAEIGFLTHAREEQLLKLGDYRQDLAEALYRGIAGYMNTLSHYRVAQGRAP